MKMNQNVIKAVICTMLVAFFFAVSMPVAFAATATVKEHTVKGILEPYKGALVLRDLGSGVRYHIAGQDLKSQQGKMVKITGQVTEDEKGVKTINVQQCEQVKK